ncbi:MAG: tautomerase family protein [Lachnospiraceae bacterium]|nr:tautomerase family protein [Lachnospiraceae bacterium]
MPLVKVEMLKGKSPEYKKALFECIHKGLVDSIGIEEWDRFQRIYEYEKDDFEIPSFKTDDFMIIELTVFPGRTKEQKGKVIEMITENLKNSLSIDPADVFITINEPPLENWGIGGKQKG